MIRRAAAACVLLFTLGCAPEPGYAVEETYHAIIGGQIAVKGEWPTAVSNGACDGTLIHPRIVTTGAHCLARGGPRSFKMGNSRDRAVRTLLVERCARHPDHGRVPGTDLAFCILTEEVNDVPIVPVISACEAARHLRPGATAVLVGFGNVDDGQSGGGLKRWVEVPINGLQAQNKEVIVGTREKGACTGDSGGPAFIELPDGTWRAFGVASRMGPSPDSRRATHCGSTTIYTSIPAHLAWIEQESKIDVLGWLPRFRESCLNRVHQSHSRPDQPLPDRISDARRQGATAQ